MSTYYIDYGFISILRYHVKLRNSLRIIILLIYSLNNISKLRLLKLPIKQRESISLSTRNCFNKLVVNCRRSSLTQKIVGTNQQIHELDTHNLIKLQ